MKQPFVYDDSKERLPRGERESWLNQQLAELVESAYNNAPAIRNRFDKYAIAPSEIRSVKDLEKIPVMTKDELLGTQRANPPFGGFLTVPMGDLARIFVSPGPIYDVFEHDRVKPLAKAIQAAGFAKPGDIVLLAGSFHMVPAGLIFTAALDLLGVTVVPTGPGLTALQVQIARELGVTGFCGFPSFLMSIIKEAEGMGYNWRRDFKMRWALGIGERHINILRKELEQDYGIEICQLYGTADLGILTAECEQRNGMHYNDEDAIIEIVDPRTGKQVPPGEEGEVVVTLLSKTYPLIRLGTSDLASYTDELCPCGRTSPRLNGITGMIGDHVRAKGMFIHGRELDQAMSAFSEVSKYQMVLSLAGHKDAITLRVEANENVDRAALADAITKKCKDILRLTVDKVEVLSKGTLPEGCKKFSDERYALGKQVQ